MKSLVGFLGFPAIVALLLMQARVLDRNRPVRGECPQTFEVVREEGVSNVPIGEKDADVAPGVMHGENGDRRTIRASNLARAGIRQRVLDRHDFAGLEDRLGHAVRTDPGMVVPMRLAYRAGRVTLWCDASVGLNQQYARG